MDTYELESNASSSLFYEVRKHLSQCDAELETFVACSFFTAEKIN